MSGSRVDRRGYGCYIQTYTPTLDWAHNLDGLFAHLKLSLALSAVAPVRTQNQCIFYFLAFWPKCTTNSCRKKAAISIHIKFCSFLHLNLGKKFPRHQNLNTICHRDTFAYHISTFRNDVNELCFGVVENSSAGFVLANGSIDTISTSVAVKLLERITYSITCSPPFSTNATI